MTRLGLSFAVAFVVGLALSALPAQADNRPIGSAFEHLLHGEVSREVQEDGGGLSMWTIDAGIGCANVATGGVYEFYCAQDVYWCPWGDGGCSSTESDLSYGHKVGATSGSHTDHIIFSVQGGTTGTTKLVCVRPVSGATALCPLFRRR